MVAPFTASLRQNELVFVLTLENVFSDVSF